VNVFILVQVFMLGSPVFTSVKVSIPVCQCDSMRR